MTKRDEITDENKMSNCKSLIYGWDGFLVNHDLLEKAL